MPKGLVTSRGFVRSPLELRSCSPEIDILVGDPASHPPLLDEGDLQIVAPTGVVAHLSIKTKFAKDNLLSALDNIGQTQLIINHYADPNRIWRSALFFEVPDSRTTETILSTLEASIKECVKNIVQIAAQNSRPTPIRVIDFLPTCIVALRNFVIFISSETESSVTLRMFEALDLSSACAFTDLFSAVRRWYGHGVLSELDEMIESLEIAPPHTKTISL